MFARCALLLVLAAFGAEAKLTLTEVQFRLNSSAAVLANASSGVWLLRGRGPVGDKEVHAEWDYQPFQDPDVVKKFTDAEAVSQTLFTMACHAKHKSDVDGLARDKAKKEAFTEKEFQAYVVQLQDGNVAEMKKRCGMINTKSYKDCHQGCTDNWATGGAFSLSTEKQRCVDRCTLKHNNWETECIGKVDELANVFKTEQGNLANTKKCVEIHCKAFPEVLMMDEKEAEDRKKEGCKEACTDKAIKARCVQRWELNVDTQLGTWQDECQDETKEGTLTPCMDEGEGKASGDNDKCKSDGEKDCTTEHDECMAEGEKAGKDSMIGANADSICGVRKKVCITQAKAKCQKDFKEAVDKNGDKCMKKHEKESKKCLDDKLKDGEKTFADECEADLKPTCKDDCKEDCSIKDMNQCKDDMIEKSFGLTGEYCTKLWEWIFDSEFHDKKTMDPLPKAEAYRFEKISRKNLDK